MSTEVKMEPGECCPTCGLENPTAVYECSDCGKEGCLEQCCPGGNNCICVECEGASE